MKKSDVQMSLRISRLGLYSTFMLAFAASMTGHAQQQASEAHVWYEGEVRHETFLRRELVADFGEASSQQSSVPARNGLQKLSGETVKRQGGVRIMKVGGTALQKASAGEIGAAQSQVFSDGSAGGPLRALPGGVIVTFEEEKTEDDLRIWAQNQGLVFDRILPLENAKTVSFKSPPGLASLEAANRVRLLDEVESAQPNWWVEKWNGPAPALNLTPQQAREARRGASERFKEADFSQSK